MAAACVSGLISGLVALSRILTLAAFAGLACIAKAVKPGLVKVALLVATGWMTLALSVHKFAGFALQHNLLNTSILVFSYNNRLIRAKR